jgi:hypothetical protein
VKELLVDQRWFTKMWEAGKSLNARSLLLNGRRQGSGTGSGSWSSGPATSQVRFCILYRVPMSEELEFGVTLGNRPNCSLDRFQRVLLYRYGRRTTYSPASWWVHRQWDWTVLVVSLWPSSVPWKQQRSCINCKTVRPFLHCTTRRLIQGCTRPFLPPFGYRGRRPFKRSQ